MRGLSWRRPFYRRFKFTGAGGKSWRLHNGASGVTDRRGGSWPESGGVRPAALAKREIPAWHRQSGGKRQYRLTGGVHQFTNNAWRRLKAEAAAAAAGGLERQTWPA